MVKISLQLWCLIILAAFGFANGSEPNDEIGFYELKKGDVSINLTNWGASIVSLHLPDKNGTLADVVLGYNTLKDYQSNTTNAGATVGRVANRIRGAQFTLNGTQYKLVANQGNNTIHGGAIGFADVVWKVKRYRQRGLSPHIIFTYHSFDGEQGFPGDLNVTVSYILTGKNQLIITMEAIALNKPTPVSLVNHAFWNLGGHTSGTILSNYVQIFGSHITVVDSLNIPTGEISPVNGTAYDFLEPQVIAKMITKLPKGYDINYVLDGGENKMKPAAIVHDMKSGRVLELSTNAPGLQFYTGSGLKNVTGKGGFVYQPYAGLCLETQAFPDSVNHPNFPSTIVSPGKPYKHVMHFTFSTK